MTNFSKLNLDEFLANYEIGTVISTSQLDSGFESDNIKITTSGNEYVLRIIHHPKRQVIDTMMVYELLIKNGIKTAKPIKTVEGNYVLEVSDTDSRYISLQEFVPGKPILRSNKKEVLENITFFGKQLGNFHKKTNTLKIYPDDLKSRLENYRLEPQVISHPNLLQEAANHSSPEVIRNLEQEVKKFRKKIEQFQLIDFKSGLIHGDIKPGDFLIQNGQLSGILDFGTASLHYILFDIATFGMYASLYKAENEKYTKEFLKSYLQEFPEMEMDMKYTHFFFKTRALVQIFYFLFRLQQNQIQGVNTKTDNVKGYKDGLYFLEQANRLQKISSHYFYDLITMS